MPKRKNDEVKEIKKRFSQERFALQCQIRTLESKIDALEKELVSALEEHSRALVQRNHAEEITQSFYEALRKVLRMVRA